MQAAEPPKGNRVCRHSTFNMISTALIEKGPQTASNGRKRGGTQKLPSRSFFAFRPLPSFTSSSREYFSKTPGPELNGARDHDKGKPSETAGRKATGLESLDQAVDGGGATEWRSGLVSCDRAQNRRHRPNSHRCGRHGGGACGGVTAIDATFELQSEMHMRNVIGGAQHVSAAQGGRGRAW